MNPEMPPTVDLQANRTTPVTIHPYASLTHGRSLAHIGVATEVPEWGTPVLIRAVSGGGFDAMGIYPLTELMGDADIFAGLARLRALGLISATLVPDPLTGPSNDTLATAFDIARPFKTHLTLDPSAGRYAPSAHHRERIRRGRRRCRIEQGTLRLWLPEWLELYAGLVKHRAIEGGANFPPTYFAALALEPAVTAFAAWVNDRIVGLTLWFAHNGVVYNHLTAVNAVGYASGASYALYDSAITAFEGHGIINLGGGVGDDAEASGLYAFKRGFSNGGVTTLLCGAILDAGRYRALGGDSSFFPAYRAPSAKGSPHG